MLPRNPLYPRHLFSVFPAKLRQFALPSGSFYHHVTQGTIFFAFLVCVMHVFSWFPFMPAYHDSLKLGEIVRIKP
jgi:hypothetical protein